MHGIARRKQRSSEKHALSAASAVTALRRHGLRSKRGKRRRAYRHHALRAPRTRITQRMASLLLASRIKTGGSNIVSIGKARRSAST